MNRVGRPLSFSPKSHAAKTEREAMDEWSIEASVRVKRAMRDRGWGYSELTEALKFLGIKRSTAVINRRINRGNFPAGFLLACLYVLEKEADAKTSSQPSAAKQEVSGDATKSAG